MRSIRTIAAITAIAMSWGGVVFAAGPPAEDESVEKQRRATDLAIQATQMFMRALELLIQSLPEYGPPRIDENGDIVIPRIHKSPKPAGPKPEPAEKGRIPAPSDGTPL